MSTYSVTATSASASSTPATILKLAFGAPAQNDQIVRDARAAVAALELEGGKLVLLNGPASLPVACAIAHAIGHKYGALGVFDPKLGGYVVAISHNPDHKVGDLIPAAEVKES